TALTLTSTVIGLDPAQVATGIALIYSVNPIMDMMRTATNVAGQIAVPTVVARTEGLLDDEVLNTPSAPPLPTDTGAKAGAAAGPVGPDVDVRPSSGPSAPGRVRRPSRRRSSRYRSRVSRERAGPVTAGPVTVVPVSAVPVSVVR